MYRFFIVDEQDPDTRLFSSAPFFVFSYATSQWAGSPFRSLVKISDLQIRAGSERDSNTLPNLKLLKRLVLPWLQVAGFPTSAPLLTVPISANRLPILRPSKLAA